LETPLLGCVSQAIVSQLVAQFFDGESPGFGYSLM